MHKAVMISIQPKWCELIANGKKTFEVRKTKPKLETSFKVYIYCTNTPKHHHLYDLRPYDKSGKIKLGCVQHNSTSLVADNYINGKVIGYFLCDWISTYFYGEMQIPTPAYDGDDSCIDYGEVYFISCGSLKETCLTYEEFENYGKGETLYGWHISNLVIYDEPKELSEFGLTRPFRSWGYVEEQK